MTCVKCHLRFRLLFLPRMDEIVLPAATVKGRLTHVAPFQSLGQRDFAIFPRFNDLREVLRSFFDRPSQMNPTCSRGGDSFSLPLFYIVPLRFRDEAQDLQNKVSNEGTHQILAVPGVQERHVDVLQGRHPAVVIQNNVGNRYSPNVIVVPLTVLLI